MKISIITVCYNRKDTIEQTIESVLNQSYADKEYIIIDGNSTDGTQDIIQKYKDRLAYWCSEPDNGLYDAMNKGLLHVTGDVIAFLNSDDWYEEGILEKVNQYFEEIHPDMVSGNTNFVVNGSKIPQCMPFEENSYKQEIFYTCMICHHPALFVQTALFHKIGKFDLQYKIAADHDWIMRAFLQGAKVKKVNEILTNCRDGGLSSVKTYEALLESKRIALLHLNDVDVGIGRDELEMYYDQKIKRGLNISKYYSVLERESEDIKRFLPQSGQCYIWGTGIWGERCYTLFDKFDIKIKGFIDTNKKQDKLHGYMVFRPEELSGDKISRNSIVCISSEKYQDEIKQQIHAMGIPEDRWISFAKLRDLIAAMA